MNEPTGSSAEDPTASGVAARRWAELLAGWGIPDEIVAAAPESPWHHATAQFAVDDTLDDGGLSARSARDVLPPEGASVLDVGCGGGRSSLVLVPPATRLIGVDQSGAMLDAFVSAAADAGVAASTIHGRWPDVAAATPVADLVVCHHVLYDVGDVVPFVMALTGRARLAVVVEVPVRHPMSAWSQGWQHFWGIERPDGPTDGDLVAVLEELGLEPEHSRSPRRRLSRFSTDPANLVPMARRRLCLHPDRDDELAVWLAAHPPAWVETVATIRWPGAATLD